MARSDISSGKSGVLKVGRAAYAVNVLWNDIEDHTRAAREAKEWAAGPMTQGDLCVVHMQGNQVGAGHKHAGHAKGMVPLASALTLARAGRWLGGFESGRGSFYVVATRGDRKVFHDAVYADLAPAVEAVSELLGGMSGESDYDEIVAPQAIADAVGIDAYRPTTLAEFAAGVAKAKPPKLAPISGGPSLAMLLFLALLVVGGVFGWMYYQQVLEEQRLAEEAEQMRLAASKQKEIPPPPWENKARGSKVLAECATAMQGAPRAYPGWAIQGISCSSSGVQQALTRKSLEQGGGAVTWIKQSLGDDAKGMNVLPGEGNTSVVAWSVPAIGTWGKKDGDDTDIKESKKFLQSSFEEQFVTITFGRGADTNFYATQDFVFQTTYAPERFAEILERIQGLTVDAISYDVAKNTFQVTGAFYEKKPVPVGAQG